MPSTRLYATVSAAELLCPIYSIQPVIQPVWQPVVSCKRVIRNRRVRVKVGVICPITDDLTSITVIWDNNKTAAVQWLNSFHFCSESQIVNMLTRQQRCVTFPGCQPTRSRSPCKLELLEQIHRRTSRLKNTNVAALKWVWIENAYSRPLLDVFDSGRIRLEKSIQLMTPHETLRMKTHFLICKAPSRASKGELWLHSRN